jgi:hypothetical protein
MASLDDETSSTTPSPSSSGFATPYNAESSIPATPGEGIHFTPRRAMTSFDNLVALANYQERLKDAKRVVWRDRGEPVVELETLRECFKHAARGGFRMSSPIVEVIMVLTYDRIQVLDRWHSAFALA